MPTRSPFPDPRAVGLGPDEGIQRNHVADLPAVLVGQHLADDRAVAGGDEGLPLRLGHHPFRIGVVQALRIRPRTAGRNCARPGRRRRRTASATRFHAGHRLDLRQQAHRQRLGEAGLGLGDQAVGAEEIGAAGEHRVDRLQQAEQQEGRDQRQQGEARSASSCGTRRPRSVGRYFTDTSVRRPRRPACPCPGARCAWRTRRPSDRG